MVLSEILVSEERFLQVAELYQERVVSQTGGKITQHFVEDFLLL
mgnify:FL=1